MNVEKKLILNRFKPRWYQIPPLRALETGNKRRILLVWARRMGKDIFALNAAIRQLVQRVGTVYYIFPTFTQARRSLWDAIDIQGRKILDYYIPDELIKAKNSSEMKITFLNGSVLQFLGSENYDRLRGTNPFAVVFSEYATQNPMAYSTIRPILAANNGLAIFCSTPFGKNHFWDLYQIAQNSSDWYCDIKTVDDAQHIPQHEIDTLRATGEMSEEMIQQEFYVNFNKGTEGSYYAKIINQLRLDNRISTVPYESAFPVHTAWDIGFTDATAIIFFQIIGQSVHLIDYYENHNLAMEAYVKVVLNKPYTYGKHIGPHDIVNKNSSNGLSPMMIASQLGLQFTKGLDRGSTGSGLDRWGGIQIVKSKLPTFWIDEPKCAKLLKALDNYSKKYNTKTMDFDDAPSHNFASHGSDALRVLCTSLSLAKGGNSPEELNKRYQRAMYGTGSAPQFYRKWNE